MLNDLTGKQFGKLTVIRYSGSARNRSVWECECECGNIVKVNQMELQRGDTLSCGCLRSSFGELQIESVLKENQIDYKKEFSFANLVSENGVPLRFDFAVFKNNKLDCLIEYDGEQHYLSKADKMWSDTLLKRRERDKIKNQYALNNGILLYRIPYWEKNNITFDTIFDKSHLITKI